MRLLTRLKLTCKDNLCKINIAVRTNYGWFSLKLQLVKPYSVLALLKKFIITILELRCAFGRATGMFQSFFHFYLSII